MTTTPEAPLVPVTVMFPLWAPILKPATLLTDTVILAPGVPVAGDTESQSWSLDACAVKAPPEVCTLWAFGVVPPARYPNVRLVVEVVIVVTACTANVTPMFTGGPFADPIVTCPKYVPGASPVGSAVMLTVAGVDLVEGVSDFSQELEVVTVNRTEAPFDVT